MGDAARVRVGESVRQLAGDAVSIVAGKRPAAGEPVVAAVNRPTVCTNQKSRSGPVRASKLRRCRSGQIPVAR